MCVELKIKIKSLAAEAVIIKKEERKLLERARRTNGADIYKKYQEVYLHRVQVVRQECRATHLAYAYIRGQKSPETKFDKNRCDNIIILRKVAYMVGRYSDKGTVKWVNSRYEPTVETIKKLEDWLSS